MEIRKWFSILIVTLMFAAPMAVYSEAQATETSKQEAAVVKTEKLDYSFLNDKTGTVTFSRLSEDIVKDAMNKLRGCKIKQIVYNDSITGCLSMLKSGRADFMISNDVTANYVTQRNPDIKAIVFFQSRAN